MTETNNKRKKKKTVACDRNKHQIKKKACSGMLHKQTPKEKEGGRACDAQVPYVSSSSFINHRFMFCKSYCPTLFLFTKSRFMLCNFSKHHSQTYSHVFIFFSRIHAFSRLTLFQTFVTYQTYFSRIHAL